MKLVFYTLLILASNLCLAQTSEKDWKKHQVKIEKSTTGNKVEISYDTLFHNGKPYCIYDEGEKFLGNVLELTIKDLTGNEVIWGKMVTGQEINRPEVVTAYELTFVNTSSKALFINVIGNSLARDVVKFNLFEEGQFNPASESKFIHFHPFRSGQPPIPNGYLNQQSGSGNHNLVQRNRNQMIQIFGNEIKQDFKLIGYLNETRQFIGGKSTIIYNITLPDGTIIASATNEDAFSHEWKIVTSNDNKIHQLNSSLGKDKNDVAEYLVKMLYL